jgi:hypothetical protein
LTNSTKNTLAKDVNGIPKVRRRSSPVCPICPEIPENEMAGIDLLLFAFCRRQDF